MFLGCTDVQEETDAWQSLKLRQLCEILRLPKLYMKMLYCCSLATHQLPVTCRFVKRCQQVMVKRCCLLKTLSTPSYSEMSSYSIWICISKSGVPRRSMREIRGNNYVSKSPKDFRGDQIKFAEWSHTIPNDLQSVLICIELILDDPPSWLAIIFCWFLPPLLINPQNL